MSGKLYEVIVVKGQLVLLLVQKLDAERKICPAGNR